MQHGQRWSSLSCHWREGEEGRIDNLTQIIKIVKIFLHLICDNYQCVNQRSLRIIENPTASQLLQLISRSAKYSS